MNISPSKVSSKPNAEIHVPYSIGDLFAYLKNMKNDNSFGWTASSVDSHMIKNIEWGAVAYLAQSIYGINKEVTSNDLIINNMDYTSTMSGCAGGGTGTCDNPWNSLEGVEASTTSNITGVYDMSGGSLEFVSAYYSERDISTDTHFMAQVLIDSYNLDGSKYVDYYSEIPNSNFYGDAMHETTSIHTEPPVEGPPESTFKFRTWYDDMNFGFRNEQADLAVLFRGGSANFVSLIGPDVNGIYSYYASLGFLDISTSRAVLCLK